MKIYLASIESHNLTLVWGGLLSYWDLSGNSKLPFRVDAFEMIRKLKDENIFGDMERGKSK